MNDTSCKDRKYISSLMLDSKYIKVPKALISHFNLQTAVLIGQMIILSHNWQWFKAEVRWIQSETGLSRHQQKQCKKQAIEDNLLLVKKTSHVPPVTLYSINYKRLKEIINYYS